MNQIKKLLGLVWMALGPVSAYLLIRIAWQEISAKPVWDTWIQWGIFVGVFLPIAAGMVLFGYYAWKGEYQED